MTYKIGDKVRIVGNKDSLSFNVVGDVGVITEIDEYGDYRVYVHVRGDGGNWMKGHEIELCMDAGKTTTTTTTYTRILEAMLTTEQVATAKRIAEAV